MALLSSTVEDNVLPDIFKLVFFFFFLSSAVSLSRGRFLKEISLPLKTFKQAHLPLVTDWLRFPDFLDPSLLEFLEQSWLMNRKDLIDHPRAQAVRN